MVYQANVQRVHGSVDEIKNALWQHQKQLHKEMRDNSAIHDETMVVHGRKNVPDAVYASAIPVAVQIGKVITFKRSQVVGIQQQQKN